MCLGRYSLPYIKKDTIYNDTKIYIFAVQMENVSVGNRIGTLHFIRFPTSEMPQFLELSKSKGMATLASTICATGGGAYKFEQDFQRVGINVCVSPSTPPAAGGPPGVGREGMVATGGGSQVVEVLLALRGINSIFLLALSSSFFHSLSLASCRWKFFRLVFPPHSVVSTTLSYLKFI